LAIRVFPVAAEGRPHFADDFDATKHLGIDIFADAGTPVVAVDDGTVRFADDPKGGQVFYLTTADGTVYYGAHLSAWEGASPRAAVAGEVLGYVGTTGNAAGTSAHLHFMVKPFGGVAVDPYRALSALTPPSVTSSLGATDQVLPPPAPGVDPLPRIPSMPGPVPPIPRAPVAQRGRGGLVLVFGLGLGGLALAASRRARAPRRAFT
jgi:murein DD-endopeptidase MepM/ murein hydrolase activator NlpD